MIYLPTMRYTDFFFFFFHSQSSGAFSEIQSIHLHLANIFIHISVQQRGDIIIHTFVHYGQLGNDYRACLFLGVGVGGQDSNPQP